MSHVQRLLHYADKWFMISFDQCRVSVNILEKVLATEEDCQHDMSVVNYKRSRSVQILCKHY